MRRVGGNDVAENLASTMTRFGVIQDYIGRDGRSRILAILVARLNERGIVPDVLTLSDAEDAADFRDFAEEGLEFELVQLPRRRVRLGHTLTQMALPLQV